MVRVVDKNDRKAVLNPFEGAKGEWVSYTSIPPINSRTLVIWWRFK